MTDLDSLITVTVQRDQALAKVAELEAKLNQPCGSCHPCVNYRDETWRAADRKPPHVYEWDETRQAAKRYRLAWQSAARRARQARNRGLVDAENAIRDEARVSGRQLNRLILGMAARLVADLQERR